MTLPSSQTARIYLLLLFLVIIGGFLRFYKLSTQSYWMDEGYTINAILSISEKGASVLDSGQPYTCPLYCYPTAYLTKVFGQNAFSYRFLAALAGVIFIALLFFVIRHLFNTNIALITSFFVTFSYWQIAWSRQARWYTLFSIFFWLSLYFFYQALYSDKKRILYICLTLLSTILASLTHGLGYLLPLVYIAWIILNRKSWLVVVSLSAVVFFILEKIFHLDFIMPFLNNIHLSFELPYYLSFYLRTYWPFIILAIIGFVYNKRFRKESRYLLVAFAVYLIPLSFLTNIVQYRYLFHLTPVFYILGSVGIVSIYSHFSRRYQQITFGLVVIAIFFVTGMGVLKPTSAYYLESDNPKTLGPRSYYAYTPQPDWNAAYEFIKNNRRPGDIVISSQPPFNKIFLGEAGYWIKYQYLGIKDAPFLITNDREYYVGALVVDDLAELATISQTKHGYIVFDYMAADGRVPQTMLDYIRKNFEQVFYKKTNAYSQIWVYRF